MWIYGWNAGQENEGNGIEGKLVEEPKERRQLKMKGMERSQGKVKETKRKKPSMGRVTVGKVFVIEDRRNSERMEW